MAFQISEARDLVAAEIRAVAPEVLDLLVLDLWQRGRCAMCGSRPPVPLVSDHCHASGLLRGLVCVGCNGAEGRQQRAGGGRHVEAIQRYRAIPPTALLHMTIPHERVQRVKRAQLLAGYDKAMQSKFDVEFDKGVKAQRAWRRLPAGERVGPCPQPADLPHPFPRRWF